VNDNDFQTLRAEIERQAEWWIGCLGLRTWDVNLQFERGYEDNDKGGRTTATVDVHPEYMMFAITFYCGALYDSFGTPVCSVTEQQRMIERTILHELAHVLVAELRPLPNSDRDWSEWLFHEERVVSQLTNALVWTAEDASDRPRAQDVLTRAQSAEAEQDEDSHESEAA